jgi:hypothetical protein
MFLANKLNKGAASAAAKDPQFNYVTMLLHGDGTNGAQNNTFLDSSTNNFTITRNGNTTQGSFSPYGSNWSNYFDGTGDYITTPSTSGSAFGTGDYTLEAWVNPNVQIAAYAGILSTFSGSGIIIEIFSGVWHYYDGTAHVSSGVTVTIGAWTHIALSRSSGTLRFFVNGVVTNSTSNSFNASASNPFTFGSIDAQGYDFNGYISNARVVKGTAVYTSNFTPSTTALTAITNTQLLTCQNNRFIDNSTNAFALTITGTPSVQRFNPFGASTAYSTSVIGGSGYFDGTGDYLTIADNAAFTLPADFTIECWFFQTGAFKDTLMIDKWTEYYLYTRANGVIGLAWGPYNASGMFGVGGIVQSGSNGFVLNAWTHVAAVRNSNTFTLYINGVSVSTATNSATVTAGGAGITIGNYSGGGYAFEGYMSNARIVKGTAVYTAAFTPPTAPVTAISGTSLLTNFTNGAIFDNAMMNDLETVGNAQISTSVVKYGTGSLAFDGTGDYLVSNSATPNLYAFGTGDFTIEFWIRYTSVTGIQALYDGRPSNTQGAYPTIYSNAGSLRYYANTSDQITGSTLSTNVWYHIAVSRSGTSTKLFIDGTQSGSTYTDSTAYLGAVGRPSIGDGLTFGTYPFNGYIDDLRITKGYARYTATFTPPTAAFLDIGPT